ncbi:alpha/beta hydrolase family protein [Tenacibaculum sp. M341]|uniref:alpha/beta hydrolase family protein n=1 Tax=Tenacibaculum sp. M341 TaxID=2530339 RepID=UPI001045A220|nr:alpha/beta fold hydrolase [Tenacibaculum sp. M341]TCI92223.1 alpha/beta fold hydrolase [Tenacibaculum sp. M341]
MKNIVLQGKHQKPILLDTFYTENKIKKPIVIFCHGYKGFKDWGAWDLMAKTFADAGFFFVKFNFSHNGGTVDNPIDFPDLEAFGNNNYTKELDDLESVIDWCLTENTLEDEMDLDSIFLVGHSRAGGIVTIKAAEDDRVKKVISLAGVSDYKRRTATTGDLEEWKRNGIKYVTNSRTKQEMPHFYQFYENFIENEERLTIQRAVDSLKVPYLIIHGDEDDAISVDEAYALNKWNPESKLAIIEGANHVFGAKHPWNEKEMPFHLEKATSLCVDFFQD